MNIPRPAFSFDVAEVLKGLDLLAPDVFELRVLNCLTHGDRRSATLSGYFDRDHFDEVIAALRSIHRASGVYFTPNEVKPELLARAYNRVRLVTDREPLTTDRDIARRRWLLVDIDADRPRGISATETEKAAALSLANAVDCYLWERGFPPGIIGDSGNGAHVMIPIDLPADDRGWHQSLLKQLARELDMPAAKIDISVFNPARIWKLPGTLVCKGDHCPQLGREWRVSRVVSVCRADDFTEAV